MREFGYITFQNFIPDDVVNRALDRLEAANVACAEIQKKNGISNSEDTVHHLIGQFSVFEKCLTAFQSIDAHLESYFKGKYILNSFGGNLLRSGSYASMIHRDIRTFSGALPLLLNSIIMLDDFTEHNGGTWILPESHRMESQPSEKEFWDGAIQVEEKAGTLLLFNSNMWHAAGKNYTDKPRRSITPMFCKPFIKPQFDYPRNLGYEKADVYTPWMRQVLGYNSRIPATLDEWYQTPEKRFYRKDQE